MRREGEKGRRRQGEKERELQSEMSTDKCIELNLLVVSTVCLEALQMALTLGAFSASTILAKCCIHRNITYLSVQTQVTTETRQQLGARSRHNRTAPQKASPHRRRLRGLGDYSPHTWVRKMLVALEHAASRRDGQGLSAGCCRGDHG